MNELTVKRQDYKQRTFKQAFKVATGVALSYVLVAPAQAAEITAVGSGLSEEIDATKSIVLTLFGAGAVLLGIFAGYRYLKRGANSA